MRRTELKHTLNSAGGTAPRSAGACFSLPKVGAFSRSSLNRRPLALALIFAVCSSASPVLAQPSKADRDSDRAERIRRAERLLEELRRRRPEPEVIPPASSIGREPAAPKPLLLPEGTAVVDRTGSIRLDGEWWVFDLDPQPAVAPISPSPTLQATELKLLPNSTLEAMVRMARAAAGPMKFKISGELTVFQGENYLLPRSAVRAPAPHARAADTIAADQSAPAAETDSGKPPEKTPPVAWDADAEDVLARMRDLNPEMPATIRPEATPPPTRRNVRPSAAFVLEGSSLVARTGRLIRDGSGWLFAFDSSRPDEPDSSFRLLPNRSLEFMTGAAQNDASGPTFVVSGEVTAFEGQNHLLVRTVTRPLQTGNLRR
jgi:hypothetical protein